MRADGRLVNMSGVFCVNNAQAPSLFSNVTLTSRRSTTYDRLLVSVTLEKREGACALFVQKTPDTLLNMLINRMLTTCVKFASPMFINKDALVFFCLNWCVGTGSVDRPGFSEAITRVFVSVIHDWLTNLWEAPVSSNLRARCPLTKTSVQRSRWRHWIKSVRPGINLGANFPTSVCTREVTGGLQLGSGCMQFWATWPALPTTKSSDPACSSVAVFLRNEMLANTHLEDSSVCPQSTAPDCSFLCWLL